MKKFLFHFLVFLLPIVLAANVTDKFISSKLRKSNIYALGEYPTWNALFDGKTNSEIVIYGSSRAWREIDPIMIGDSLNITAFNLGDDGNNFRVQYLRHLILLQYNPHPKLIICSLDDFTLANKEDIYNPDQLLPYMRYNNTLKNNTKGFKIYNDLDFDLPLVRYYGKEDALNSFFRTILHPSDTPAYRIKGFISQDQRWNNDFENIKKKMRSYRVNIDTAVVRVFESFLLDCKNKKIPIVFVYTPEYIEGQKFIKNRAEIMEIYTRFSTKYKVPFYDYSNNPMSYQKELFFNVMHLNSTGTPIFTRKLIDTLRKTNMFKETVKLAAKP